MLVVLYCILELINKFIKFYGARLPNIFYHRKSSLMIYIYIYIIFLELKKMQMCLSAINPYINVLYAIASDAVNLWSRLINYIFEYLGVF